MARRLMEAITCRLCFGDLLWARRNELTFAAGVYAKDDYRVIEERVEACHAAGMGVRANEGKGEGSGKGRGRSHL